MQKTSEEYESDDISMHGFTIVFQARNSSQLSPASFTSGSLESRRSPLQMHMADVEFRCVVSSLETKKVVFNFTSSEHMPNPKLRTNGGKHLCKVTIRVSQR